MVRCHSAHPEGLRERPVEVPATLLPTARSRWGRCQFRLAAKYVARKMRRKGLRHHGRADSCREHQFFRRGPRSRRRAFLSRMRRAFRARPHLRLRVLFRAARSGVRPAERLPRRAEEAHRRGPGQHLAVRAAAARPLRCRGQAQHQPRLHEAGQGRQPRPRARRDRRTVRQGRLRQSDALLQGPCRRHRRRGGPRLRVHHPLLLLHRQPGRCGGCRRRPRRLPLLRVHPARPGAGQGRHGRGVRR